ncbi:MAG: sel1 repeat family protein, partial [Gammaproteobacteria bacterium]
MTESPDDIMDFNSGIAAFEAKHFSRAMKLLSPIAESGSAEAQYRLAIMYQNGLGVVRNELLAYKWMKSA